MGMMGIVMIVMGAMAGGTSEGRPIVLTTETTASGVTVQVVGEAPEPFQAAYTLEVSSGMSGGNRSVQKGTARLSPGQRAVLLTAHLGGSAGVHWKARLHVHPASGGDYEILEQAN